MTGGHSVLISSEEQFKVFSLPTLRPRNKEKLTAVDGSRVRKLGVVDVPGKTPGKCQFFSTRIIICFVIVRIEVSKWISLKLSFRTIVRFSVQSVVIATVKKVTRKVKVN